MISVAYFQWSHWRMRHCSRHNKSDINRGFNLHALFPVQKSWFILFYFWSRALFWLKSMQATVPKTWKNSVSKWFASTLNISPDINNASLCSKMWIKSSENISGVEMDNSASETNVTFRLNSALRIVVSTQIIRKRFSKRNPLGWVNKQNTITAFKFLERCISGVDFKGAVPVLQVIQRIFYTVNRSWSGKITLTELRKSNFLQVCWFLPEQDLELILLLSL